MKLIALLAAMVLGSSMAHASFTNDQVDVQEASNALVRCAEQAKQLLPSEDAYLGAVVGQYTNVSTGVDVKAIRFQSLVGGLLGGPAAETVATLVVTHTVKQNPHGGPSSVSYSCQLSK